MNLQNLTDEVLHTNTQAAARAERLATTELLHHLLEVQKRRLFAKQGCSSLFDYCVRVLKMSEGHASRRIGAMKALGDCPEIENKINSGVLSVTALSQAQTFFQREAQAGNKVSADDKLALITRLESKPTREVERILISESSAPEKMVKESTRLISATSSEVRLAIDAETIAHLARLKEIWSHEMPSATYSDVIRKAAKLCRTKHDPTLRAERLRKKN